MAEHMEADLEERAWATAQARAFLAPRARQATPVDEPPRPAAVVAVVVVPLPVPPRVDEHQEDERNG